MLKNTNLCVDLKTVMQNDALLVEGQCYSGVLTRDSEDHYVFEESVNKGGRCLQTITKAKQIGRAHV